MKTTSDDAYLDDYDYSGTDRLESELNISRYRRDELISTSLLHYELLRDNESDATQPSIIGNAEYERRFFPRLGRRIPRRRGTAQPLPLLRAIRRRWRAI